MTHRAILLSCLSVVLTAVLTAVFATAAPGRSEARPSSMPSAGAGSIMFVRGSAIWRAPVRAAGKAVAIANLGDVARRVTRLEAAPGGGAVLVELGKEVGWIRAGGKPRRGDTTPLRMLACVAPARFSPEGDRIACTVEGGRTALYVLASGGARAIHYPASRILGFRGSDRLVVQDRRGLWADSVAVPGRRTLLSPHLPTSDLLVAPDGRRAVGIFPPLRKADTAGLYVFQLDGNGVRRRLLAQGTPVVWSMDSRWLLAQSSEEGACIVRAVGGEYKCWSRFEAVSLAPDGSYALLARPAEDGTEGQRDLYVGQLEGVRPAPPVLLERGVSGPATWVPPSK